MTTPKRTVTGELDLIEQWAIRCGLPYDRDADSINVKDTTLGRSFAFFANATTHGIRVGCYEIRTHRIGNERKLSVRRSKRYAFGMMQIIGGK